MKIKFDYTPYPSADYTGRDTLAWRPMVDVTLFGPKDFRNIKALIDTGADDCLIHRDFSEILGVEFIGKKKVIGVGSDVGSDIVVDYAEVEIMIKHFNKKIKTIAGFAELPYLAYWGRADFLIITA
jgi:hypothetical protein